MMRAKKAHAENLEHTKRFAARIFNDLKKKKRRKKATVIGLSGELGSGKTTFTKELARLFGVTRTVASPTFVLERIYKLGPKHQFDRLIHIDAYRLENGMELFALGWEALLDDPGNLILIEWPEKVADAMPKKYATISFEHRGETQRGIEFFLQ